MRTAVYGSFSLKWPSAQQVNVGTRPRITEMAHAAPGQKNRIPAEDWLSGDPTSPQQHHMLKINGALASRCCEKMTSDMSDPTKLSSRCEGRVETM